MNDLTNEELMAAKSVILNAQVNTLALTSLLSTAPHWPVQELFRDSQVLGRAVMANVLARLMRAPVQTIESSAIDRAFEAYRAMKKLGTLPRRREALGIMDARTIGSLLRGDAVSDFELAEIFGVADTARASTRAKLEAARAVGVLPSVVGTWFIAAFYDEKAELADIIRAIAKPRYALGARA